MSAPPSGWWGWMSPVLKRAFGLDQNAVAEGAGGETAGVDESPVLRPEPDEEAWGRPRTANPASTDARPMADAAQTAQMASPSAPISRAGQAAVTATPADTDTKSKVDAPQTAQMASPPSPISHAGRPAALTAQGGLLAAQDPQIQSPPPRAPRIGDMLTDWESPLRPSSSQWPALAADGGTRAGLEVFAAASAGLGHLQEGTGCQDAFAVAPTRDGVIVSIADGVSNAPLGAVGARTSTEAATAAGRGTGPAVRALELALSSADRSLHSTAADRGVDPHAFATTLIVALVAPTHFGMHVDLIALGDSSAFVMRSPSDMTRLAGPEELGSTVLRTSLPMNAQMEPERAEASVEAGELLILVTDGLAADLMTSPGVRAWCWERWTTAESPLQASAALGYRRQGTSDDLAAVVVRPRR